LHQLGSHGKQINKDSKNAKMNDQTRRASQNVMDSQQDQQLP
jgi:hypothetical protein